MLYYMPARGFYRCKGTSFLGYLTPGLAGMALGDGNVASWSFLRIDSRGKVFT